MVRNDVIMTSSPLGAPFIKVLYLITLADEHMDLRIYILEFSKNIYGAWKSQRTYWITVNSLRLGSLNDFSNFCHIRMDEVIHA